ncbi:MAG: septal ring lytic transglycosylase RlpA family protein [Ignavibacterium sp.]|jgi:rare lipoprotein A|nr:septal ring lytic transglycosylase RlpA family protein [Ignavibacterium sp.]
MDLITRYPACIVLIILFFYGCSSTSRYSGSNDNSESNIQYKSSDVLEIETGTASFYANEFNGKKTANGEIYDMNGLTAAHPSYPFNTVVKVTNLDNGKSIEVRINDRMPNFKGRIIDLSLAAARKIEMINAGIQEVKLEVLRWGK